MVSKSGAKRAQGAERRGAKTKDWDDGHQRRHGDSRPVPRLRRGRQRLRISGARPTWPRGDKAEGDGASWSATRNVGGRDPELLKQLAELADRGRAQEASAATTLERLNLIYLETTKRTRSWATWIWISAIRRARSANIRRGAGRQAGRSGRRALSSWRRRCRPRKRPTKRAMKCSPRSKPRPASSRRRNFCWN